MFIPSLVDSSEWSPWHSSDYISWFISIGAPCVGCTSAHLCVLSLELYTVHRLNKLDVRLENNIMKWYITSECIPPCLRIEIFCILTFVYFSPKYMFYIYELEILVIFYSYQTDLDIIIFCIPFQSNLNLFSTHVTNPYDLSGSRRIDRWAEPSLSFTGDPVELIAMGEELRLRSWRRKQSRTVIIYFSSVCVIGKQCLRCVKLYSVNKYFFMCWWGEFSLIFTMCSIFINIQCTPFL